MRNDLPTRDTDGARWTRPAFAATAFGAGILGLVGAGFIYRLGIPAWSEASLAFALVAGAVMSARRVASLTTIVVTQGIAAAIVANQASVVTFRQIGWILPPGRGALFGGLMALAALVLGQRLLRRDQTRSHFAPVAHRSLLLVGAIASVASAVLYGVAATQDLHAGGARALSLGMVWAPLALVQAASAAFVMRMRGFALVTGLASASLGIGMALAWGVAFFPQLICSVVATFAWSVPLLARRAIPAAGARVRVARSGPSSLDARDRDANDSRELSIDDSLERVDVRAHPGR